MKYSRSIVRFSGFLFLCLSLIVANSSSFFAYAERYVRFSSEVEKFRFILGSLDDTVPDDAYFATQMVRIVGHSCSFLGVLCLFIATFWSQFGNAWKRYWSQTANAKKLALVRIIAFLSLAFLLISQPIGLMNLIPHGLQRLPLGWSWAKHVLPLPSVVLTSFQIIAVIFTLLAVIGWYGKLFARLSTALSLFLLGIPQFYGKIDHYHHIWIVCLICCFSPAWDAFSKMKGAEVDGLAKRTYGLPIAYIGFILALAYFYPGMWKWVYDGPFWPSIQNQSVLWSNQWGAMEEIPAITAYIPMGLVPIFAGYAMLIECACVFLLLLRPGFLRQWIWFVLPFHIGVYLLMGINFWHLPILVWALSRYSNTNDAAEVVAVDKNNRALRLIGKTILVCIMLCGSLFLDGWPIGNYPSFSGSYKPLLHRIEVLSVDGRGNTSQLSLLQFLRKHDADLGVSRVAGLTRSICWEQDKIAFDKRCSDLKKYLSAVSGISEQHIRLGKTVNYTERERFMKVKKHELIP
jgi:hypothetical protein